MPTVLPATGFKKNVYLKVWYYIERINVLDRTRAIIQLYHPTISFYPCLTLSHASPRA